jgi:hypothetical protein
MALRLRPGGSTDPLAGYAPAFDISNVMPGLCKGAVQGLREENWPGWLKRMAVSYEDAGVDVAFGPEDLHGALLLYIRAIKLMQSDPDIVTVDQAFAATGFDRIDPLFRAMTMARVMDYVNALLMVAIKDATVLTEGGTPVRRDVQAALDAVEEMIKRS